MTASENTMDREGQIGPPHVHHMDVPTAYSAAKLGMWLFLATEVLLFGGLFAAFTMYRWMYLKEFHEASTHLNRIMGATNTIVLLFSSLTAALAVDEGIVGGNAIVVAAAGVAVGAVATRACDIDA